MAERRAFGTTWWGKAWIDALEQRARLDPNRLPRGRTYARHDRVHDIELSTGEINARVQGSRPEPYTVRVHIRRFSDDEWNVVLDAITARAAHAAALLDGELDPGIVEDARAVGVDLLPGPGEVRAPLLLPRLGRPLQALGRRLLPRGRRARRRSVRPPPPPGSVPGGGPGRAAAGVGPPAPVLDRRRHSPCPRSIEASPPTRRGPGC